MQIAKTNSGLLIRGVPCLLLALFLQTATFSSERYATPLLAALFFAAFADACFVGLFLRGGVGWRVASVALMLPTVFIVLDFARRAPHVFH